MKTAYTYSILRYVHDTVTGEFINVGVALLAPDVRYASALCRSTYGRLAKTFPGMDGEAFKGLMRFIQSRFEEFGDRLQSDLDIEVMPSNVLELAHQVLPADDSSLQWSPAGSGLSHDPSKTLEALFERMVNGYEEKDPRTTRSDEQVWSVYKRGLETRHLLKHLKEKRISVKDDEVEFRYAYKNGIWHCLEPVSLDLANADSIRDKAHKWLGHISSVRNAAEEFKVYLLLGRPHRTDLAEAYRNAIGILKKIQGDKEIVPEEDAEKFADELSGVVADSVPSAKA